MQNGGTANVAMVQERKKMSERDMERLLDEVFAKVFGRKW
tara:strand:+ start:378 stop:497 length:120 start_codon:yes stop_codon:yes gene_type:complete